MLDPDRIRLPREAIVFSNARLWKAIVDVRIQGRTTETMGEVYDALSQRRRIRDQYRQQYLDWRKAVSDRISADATTRAIWDMQTRLEAARFTDAKAPVKRR